MKNTLLLACCVILSCNDPVDNTPAPVRANITWEDIEKSFQSIDLIAGIKDIEIKNVDNSIVTFRLNAPVREDNEVRPLVIALHWFDPAADNLYNEFSSRLAHPGLADLGAFIISPDGGNQIWTANSNQAKIHDLLTLAKKFWPVDNDKVTVMGFSSGGGGSWLYAQTNQTFSAAIPLASSYNTIDRIDVPMFVIHGENDEVFST